MNRTRFTRCRPAAPLAPPTRVEVALLEAQVAELSRENALLRRRLEELELSVEYHTPAPALVLARPH